VGNLTLQGILQGGTILEPGTIQAILQSSVTGAGLIFTIYTFILPITKNFFKPRLKEYQDNIKELLDKINESNPTEIIENLESINETRNKIIEQKKLPSWIDKTIVYAFLGYISSSIISVLLLNEYVKALPYRSSLEIILIMVFIISTFIFARIGYRGLLDIYNYIYIEYNTYLSQIEQVEHVEPLDIPIKVEDEIPLEKHEEIEEEIELVSYNFEKDSVGKVPENWVIEKSMMGSIQVSNEHGAEGTSQSLKIHSPENSQDVIRTSFEPQQKFILIYSLRQEIYGDKRGVGNALMLFLGKTQAIWMAIQKKKLMGFWDGELHEFCNIELEKWYKIKLEVDCVNKEYYCYVDDRLMRRGEFRNDVNYIDTIRTAGWFKQAERIGYIDEIKISRALEEKG